MYIGFEAAFMDAQSKNVALCLELLNNNNIEVDEIYIYMFQNKFQDFYNAFFRKQDKLLMLNQLFFEEDIDEFTDLGIEDIENIISICLQYEANCPHEIKLRYNVKANSLDAEYEYEDFLNDEGGLVKRFEKWFQEINLNLNSLK